MINRKEVAVSTLWLSATMLALLLLLVFSDADFCRRLYDAIGHPFGLEPQHYVALAVVAIWLPTPLLVWHVLAAQRLAKADPDRIELDGSPRLRATWALLQFLSFLVKLRGVTRWEQRVKLIALGALVYPVGVVVWWIHWTASHHI